MTKELPKWRHGFFLLPLVFYFVTAARVPGWLDASLLTYVAGQLRLSAWANHHNLFTVIGHVVIRLFGKTDPHYALVLMCGFFGAVTVYLVFLVGLEIGHPISAVLGAVALMVSHSLWWHSTMVEVYSLNSALMAGILLVLFRYRRTGRLWYVFGAFFLWGLGCSNHVLMGLFLPAFVVFAVMLRLQHRVGGWRPYLVMALCFLVGISLWLGLFIRDVIGAYETLAAGGRDGVRPVLEALGVTLDRTTGGAFKEHMFVDGISATEKRFWRLNYLFLMFVNYPSIALPLGLFGTWIIWKRDAWKSFFVFLAIAIAAQVVWSANYFIWDMYAFAQPVYVLFSVPVIYGIDWAVKRSRITRIALACLVPTLLLPLTLYPAAEAWYENGGFITRYFNNYEKLQWAKPTWHPVAYIANPNKRDYDLTERVAERLFQVLPRGSSIMTSESRLDYPMRLYYQQTLGVRTDIRYLPFFGMFLSEPQLERHAASLDRALGRATPTYISSLGPPDRHILNQLWILYDPEADPDAVARLPEAQFMQEFPGITFNRVDLIPEEGICIYRIEKRPEAGLAHGASLQDGQRMGQPPTVVQIGARALTRSGAGQDFRQAPRD